ncbi:MAG TPA: hypothetical protein PK668_23175 [Myxococcota bacterium]|nr:hypothetical protein [Myxococcota bacterium]HRY95598.1 hypothetical protein [Myxococcota bacterium]
MHWLKHFAGMLFVTALVAASPGCGQEPDCTAAAEKLEGCGLGSFADHYELRGGACEETSACIADCVCERSCAEIEGTITTADWNQHLLCGHECPQITLCSGPL